MLHQLLVRDFLVFDIQINECSVQVCGVFDDQAVMACTDGGTCICCNAFCIAFMSSWSASL